MERYKAKDIIERVGITKIQLNHWINMLAIEPLVDDRRRGGVRYFSQQNLFEALICKYLNEHRMSVTVISSTLQYIRKATYINGKTFFEAYTENPKLENYFVLVRSTTRYKKDGSVEKKPLPGFPASNRLREVWHEVMKLPWLCTEKDLVKWASEYPTSVVVNLNGIMKEANKL